jgi:hypothetical protein
MKVEVDLFAEDLGFGKRSRSSTYDPFPLISGRWLRPWRDVGPEVSVDVRRVRHLGPGAGGKRKLDS